MKVFKSPTRTAVTEWIERMTSNQYQEEDMSDVFQLCEAINLQDTGPKEANKALRRVFKYGNAHSHLLGLSVLKTLVENCGENFQAQIASPKFVERLRILATSPYTDPRVHKELMILLAQWSIDFKNKSGMYAISNLHDSLSNKRNNSFSSPKKDLSSPKKDSSSPKKDSELKSDAQPSSSTSPSPKEKRKNTKKPPKKVTPDAQTKPHTSEKINEEIGLATQNATNLINALTLLGPSADVENDLDLQALVQKCKSSSEQLVKIISMVTEGNELGPLLQSNDQVQGALEIFSNFESGLSKENKASFPTRKTEDDGINKRATTRDFNNLIDVDSLSANNSSSNSDFVYDNSLLDDPFADPVTPSRTPEPEPGRKRLEWAEI